MLPISARAIIEHEGKFLLVRLKKYGFWCLPGGGMEEGEDIKECLKREMIEELGVEPKIGNLVYIHQINDGSRLSPPSFIFHVTNSEDYFNIDITSTSHGNEELLNAEFVDVENVNVLPSFLKNELRGVTKELLENQTTQFRITQVEQ